MLRALAFLLILGAAAPASASIVLKLGLEQLVGRSDVIFVGRAVEAKSRWSSNGRKIVTDTTFVVEEAIHGTREGRQIVVRRLGGTVDGVGMKVSGAPVYRVGDRAVLFTERRGASRFTVGMRQGAVNVVRDTSGKQMVQAQLHGLGLAERSPSGAVRLLEPQPDPEPEPLGRFVERVREAITICTKESARCRPR